MAPDRTTARVLRGIAADPSALVEILRPRLRAWVEQIADSVIVARLPGLVGSRLRTVAASIGRIAPVGAVLVWYNWAGPGATWPNSGSGGTLPLSEIGGVAFAAPGQYGDVGYLPAAVGSTTDGGMLASANTIAGQGQTVVACCWFCLPLLPSGPVGRLIFGLQDGSGSWSPPYDQWGIFAAASGAIFGAVSTTVGGSNDTLISSSTGAVEAGKWYHVALVIDGGNATLYLQGVAIGTASLDGDVITGSGRFLVSGMPTAGATAPRYSAGIVADIQVFNTATPAGLTAAAYLAAVAATRREP